LARTHLRLQHLLRQLELQRDLPTDRRQPEWLRDLADDLCEAFEPLSGEARVGYESRLSEDRWELRLFIGQTELVGGDRDGQSEYVNFRLDLSVLVQQFDLVERCEWVAMPQHGAGYSPNSSHLVVDGEWRTQPVRVWISSLPPGSLGPGARRFPNGAHEMT